MPSRPLHLNLSIVNAGHHPAAWRLLGSSVENLADFAYFRGLAKAAESGKLDSVYIPDLLFTDPSLAQTPHTQRFDSLTLQASLAAVTSRVGLVAGASAVHTLPYNLARRLASFDHVSNGRAGWGIGARTDAGTRGNFGIGTEPAEAELRLRTAEFVDVLSKLWDSWEDDAPIADKQTGIYVDTDKVHEIAHVGPSFKVSGPLDVPRSPQGQPVLFQESGAKADDDLVLTYGGVIILEPADIETTQAHVEAIRKRVSGASDSVKILAPLGTIVAPVAEDAEHLRQELDKLAGADILGIITGTPANVADHIERWFTTTGIDGFDLRPPALPRDLNSFVKDVIPLLQSRSLFRSDYEGTTLRDHYGFARPASRYAAA